MTFCMRSRTSTRTSWPVAAITRPSSCAFASALPPEKKASGGPRVGQSTSQPQSTARTTRSTWSTFWICVVAAVCNKTRSPLKACILASDDDLHHPGPFLRTFPPSWVCARHAPFRRGSRGNALVRRSSAVHMVAGEGDAVAWNSRSVSAWPRRRLGGRRKKAPSGGRAGGRAGRSGGRSFRLDAAWRRGAGRRSSAATATGTPAPAELRRTRWRRRRATR